jgi:hypothetical protein
MASGCGKSADNPKDIISRFAAEREDEARQLSKKESVRWVPEAGDFFKAAEAGKWDQATNFYAQIQRKYIVASAPPTNGWGGFMVKTYASLARHGLTPTNYWPNPWGPQWRPIDDVYYAIDQFQSWDPDLLRFYATNVIDSIPTNSVFISGQDSGFFAIPAFCKSQPNGDKFITLTPNKLVDYTYLQYADELFGKTMHVPTEADTSSAFSAYLADVTQRAQKGQLKPGENFTTNASTGPTISGDVAVMEINALLFWDLFTNNPNREFFYEERWPLDWTTPYLVPHGLIFKISHAPLDVLDPNVIDQDYAYWHDIVAKLTGLSTEQEISFPCLSDFAEQVYAHADFSQFKGDPRFATNFIAQVTFAKSRVSIARVYAWRAYNSSNATERHRMYYEADLAFRQAFALDPRLPEFWQYGAFLYSFQRTNDLRLLTEGIKKIAPDGDTAKYLSGLLTNRP